MHYHSKSYFIYFPIIRKDSLQKQLEKKGVYFTHLVKELIQTLTKATKPLSFKEILSRFNKREFFPNTSSLYRQLLRLNHLSVMEKTIFSDGIKRYCLIYKGDEHCHFECKKCGDVKNIPIKNDKNLNRQLTDIIKKYDYKITTHIITIKGFCNRCATKN